MQVTHVFAGVATRDFPAALAWYERLFGRAPDRFPHDAEAVWQLTDTGLIYLVADPESAGRAVITLIVEDLEAWQAEIAGRGIRAGGVEGLGEGARRVSILDPDGNRISVAEVPHPRHRYPGEQ
ncbi:MAG TPA: VOC family protein [Solirubrobacteraceae bacterium]